MKITSGKFFDLSFFIALTIGVASLGQGYTDTFNKKKLPTPGPGSSKETRPIDAGSASRHVLTSVDERRRGNHPVTTRTGDATWNPKSFAAKLIKSGKISPLERTQTRQLSQPVPTAAVPKVTDKKVEEITAAPSLRTGPEESLPHPFISTALDSEETSEYAASHLSRDSAEEDNLPTPAAATPPIDRASLVLPPRPDDYDVVDGGPRMPVLAASLSSASREADPGLIQRSFHVFAHAVHQVKRFVGTRVSTALKALTGAGGEMMNSAWRTTKLFTQALAGRRPTPHQRPNEVPEEINLADSPWLFASSLPSHPVPTAASHVPSSLQSGYQAILDIGKKAVGHVATAGRWVKDHVIPWGQGAWKKVPALPTVDASERNSEKGRRWGSFKKWIPTGNRQPDRDMHLAGSRKAGSSGSRRGGWSPRSFLGY